MEVQFQKYLGGNAWLCRYNPPNLQVLRNEPYVRDAALIPPQQKLDPVISEPPTESGEPSEQITTVDIALHFKADQDVTALSQKIQEITGVSIDDMEIFHGVRTVRLDVPNSKLLDIAKIDDVASLSEVPELEFCNNIARQVMRADIKINETDYKGKD